MPEVNKMPIKKALETVGSTVEANGFFKNIGKFGVSYLLFSDNFAVSLSGYCAEQFANYENKLLGKKFAVLFEKRHSKTYNKDFAIIKKIKVIGSKENVEFEEAEVDE